MGFGGIFGRGALALSLAASLCAPPALAASPAETDSGGVLRVQVFDEEDHPLPGTRLTLWRDHADYEQWETRSDAEGWATFRDLLPADGYSLLLRFPDYAPVIRDGIEILPTATVTLLVKLNPAMVETVRLDHHYGPLVDLDEGGTNATSFSSEFIADLPILDRNYQGVLTRAPGVNDTDEDGNPNVHGSRERDFKATVDGVSNVDPLTGWFMSNLNPDAIAEIEIITSGAGAEYGGATGGFARVTTKSGGNEFEGVFNLYLRSSRLDGNGATDLPADEFDYDRVQPSISLTGPALRDHLWYSLNHEYIRDGNPVVLLNETSATTLTTGWRHYDKLTWQVSARNRLELSYSADPLEVGPLGFTNLTPVESGYGYSQGGPTYRLRWWVPYSPYTSWEATVAFSDTSVGFTPTSRGITNSCVRDLRGELAPAERFGQAISEDYCIDTERGQRTGSYWRDFEDQRQRWTYEVKGERFVPDFLGADHRLSMGVNVEDIDYVYDHQLRPTSVLEPLLDYEAPELVVGGGQSPTGKRLAAILYREVALGSDEESFLPSLFDQSRSADGLRYAAWIEDTFRPAPNFSVRLGLRYQREELNSSGFEYFDPAAENRAFHRGFDTCWAERGYSKAFIPYCRILAFNVFTGYENEIDHSRKQILKRSGRTRVPESFTVSDDNLAPRISISWDPWNDGRTKIFSTWGRYHGDIFLLPILAEQGPNSVTSQYNVRVRPDGPMEVGINPTHSTAFTVSQVDRGLESPYSDEFTIGFEREVASETSLAVTYLNRRYRQQLQDVDVNHYARDIGTSCVFDPDTGFPWMVGPPDGELDDCIGTLVPDGFGGLGEIIWKEAADGQPDLFLHNPLFNQILRIGNYNQTNYEALQVVLRRRFLRNWEMEASYVVSEAIGNAEDYGQGLGDDPTTVVDEYGHVAYDQRHLVKVSARTFVPRWGGFRLGSSVTWETGLPYSLVETRAVIDGRTDFAGSAYRYLQNKTIYTTGQRNDQRSPAFWTIDVNLQKEFAVGPTLWAVQLDVFNLLNDDVIRVEGIDNGSLTATRRFGRRFQAALKVAF